MSKIKVLVSGYTGRMGQAILQALKDHPTLEYIAGLDVNNMGDEAFNLVRKADVVIDFSSHDSHPLLTEACRAPKTPIVIGTTGLDDQQEVIIKDTAAEIPVVKSSNFSTGVNVLFALTKVATELLGDGYDPEIVEYHHRLKKDAPSGTAKSLAQVIATARQLSPEEAARHGRKGIVGARTKNEIGIHAVRGGTIVGKHDVIFAGPREVITLSHEAEDRAAFALGSLRAAEWIIGKAPGLYDMQDVLGLRQR
jgi:4-hydroxy-tetrahydrodipicolinate reductase